MSRTARVAIVAASTALIAGAGLATATITQASTPPFLHNPHHQPHHHVHAQHHFVGRINDHFQNRNGSIVVSGTMFDGKHRSARTWACLNVNGHCAHKVHANLPSPKFSKQHHLRGGHRFQITLSPRVPGAHLALRALPNHRWLAARDALSPGDRVVQVAKRFVGGNYVWGGSSPRTGFDCSGYAMYSYREAHVASLPHNSNAQRFAPGMHTIPRSRALPGDLIFYFSGGSAYHVAIYAGHGMQYSAADPRDGIRYQRIWASNISFGTNWH